VKYKGSNYLGEKMGNISRLSSACLQMTLLNNIWTHSLNCLPKLNLLNTWSTHPHSTRSKVFCWSKNILIPSSSSRSVYYITSCIRRLASLILRPLTTNSFLLVNDTFDKKELTPSQYKGVLTLLHKSGEREDIRNCK
jgi:hypothetical protein